MTETEDLRQRIAAIEARNERVEADKAWETSWTRRLCIAGTTYVTALALFASLGLPIPVLQALIPSAAYLLSTLSLPWIRQRWIAARNETMNGKR